MEASSSGFRSYVVSGGRKANFEAILPGHGGQQNRQQSSLKLSPFIFSPFCFCCWACCDCGSCTCLLDASFATFHTKISLGSHTNMYFLKFSWKNVLLHLFFPFFLSSNNFFLQLSYKLATNTLLLQTIEWVLLK